MHYIRSVMCRAHKKQWVWASQGENQPNKSRPFQICRGPHQFGDKATCFMFFPKQRL